LKRRQRQLLAIIFLTFVALGLPDALVGSGWNLMRAELNAPLGALGWYGFAMFVMTITATYVTPSVLRRMDTKHTVLMALMLMMGALFAMSFAQQFNLLIVFALPLAFGAGMIDMSLNHVMAAQYKAHHMNFLHAFYGIGVTLGPGIMALTLAEENWRLAFRFVALILLGIAASVRGSFRLWHEEPEHVRSHHHPRLKLKTLLTDGKAVQSLFIFVLIVHVESLGGYWIASYIYLTQDVSLALAAGYTSIFFLALTLGRLISTVLSTRWSSQRLILLGQGLIVVAALLLRLDVAFLGFTMMAVFLYGLGCAPVFPNMLYLNREMFPASWLSKMVSIQMTFGYVGFGVLTPLAGLAFERISVTVFPSVLLGYAVVVMGLTLWYFKASSKRLHEA
jgi:fucose permease